MSQGTAPLAWWQGVGDRGKDLLLTRLRARLLVLIPFLATPARAQAPKDWLRWKAATRTVTLTLTAGVGGANSGWNFNGVAEGRATITVPLGATVQVDFTNRDGGNVHSVGVVEVQPQPPSSGDGVKPAFPGAFSVPFTRGSIPGSRQRFSFQANRPGRFWLFCGVPPHGLGGMWIYLVVSRRAAAPSVHIKEEG